MRHIKFAGPPITYTPEDVAKIMKALTDEVSACRKKFEIALKRQSKPEFELE